MPQVNETCINFGVYEDGNEYYGQADITLPDLELMAQDITGAGIAGTVSAAVVGHYNAMTASINFRTICPSVVRLAEPRDHQLDVRGAMQVRDTATGKVSVQAVKVVMKCQPKTIKLGKLAPASPADASGDVSVSYIALYIDGEKVAEIDPYNFIAMVNGTDYLAEVRKALGK